MELQQKSNMELQQKSNIELQQNSNIELQQNSNIELQQNSNILINFRCLNMSYSIYVSKNQNIIEYLKNNMEQTIKKKLVLPKCLEYMVYMDNKMIGHYNYEKEELNITDFSNINTETNTEIFFPNVVNIEFRPILKGGSGLGDLVIAIGSIGELFILAYKGVAYLIELFIWGVKVLVWVFSELANPKLLIDEFGATMTTLIFSLVYGPFQILYYLFQYAINMFDRTVFNGFWGWDTRPYDKIDADEAVFFGENNKCNGKKCYAKPDGKIPFNVIIGTIVCPPLGVFMEYGLTGWLNIIICILLSLCLYFPGLIYALICLYC
jgi:uncharacterized membrane protein YqaE (UPF0057 family)